jgi:hypothetical protein
LETMMLHLLTVKNRSFAIVNQVLKKRKRKTLMWESMELKM